MSSVGPNVAIGLTVIFLVGLVMFLAWKGKQMTRNFALAMFDAKRAHERRQQRAAARANGEGGEGHELQSTEPSSV
ncbi:hypothetical protein F5X96DRAFT_619685 [Biscogniauxia mediterranea]|nr:hypothetical protein F5X96DRAFT_619685 [Biscogniauxia mediterranea]